MSAAMGMMHEGYFVGRKELTAWIRQNFDAGFQKVEDLANGVVYCQILNSVHPGSIPMAKVKMGAKTEVDFIHNFKLLQTGFNKKKIDRYIEVDKLTKRSFQFNMEFLQYMKCYWDMHAPDSSAAEAVFKEAPPNMPVVKEVRKAATPGAAAIAAASPSTNTPGMPAAASASAASAAARTGASAAVLTAAGGADERAKAAVYEQVTELKISVENLERERDFYYSKLREVEVLCQSKEEQQVPFLKEVLEILYKMDDAEEFAPPEQSAAA
uniref:Calponin-homology (CH) domain-containing protein n=1 Tax=Calcidiscus leptoporus TaxID=127549 RepID=A0A7S0P206_9EUKA|mmetsp:Transcript_48965/g.113208  ORF Transcript_48965/g.113208 Transcript_48965/m.113208 type:complete len:269 (+) Transcript_48965:74-880(+)|eukprot:CAMPEP_0119404220 /NCGR_PEP_ID=MMETSP1334-20130426/143782_1 /TAXON_ID=127549 /ORGANISM="Calcidiscus leptoporus, Strain RCC1130" /LENGTH=268 /DNA_ID=CAMNT_0007428179 /DNA_START=68 /DNA_END=874 /DNA_ORIENTATION=+